MYYLCTTAFAIVIGLLGGSLFKGLFPVLETSELSYEATSSVSFMDTLVNIFPSNIIEQLYESTMLQVIVITPASRLHALLAGAISLLCRQSSPLWAKLNTCSKSCAT